MWHLNIEEYLNIQESFVKVRWRCGKGLHYKMIVHTKLLIRPRIETVEKLPKSIISDGCNNYIVPRIRVEEGKIQTIFGENTMPCHQKLGHAKEKELWVLYDNDMVNGMPKFSLYFYFFKHFLYEKYNRVRFSFSSIRWEKILWLDNNDVFGSVLLPSTGKYV